MKKSNTQTRKLSASQLLEKYEELRKTHEVKSVHFNRGLDLTQFRIKLFLMELTMLIRYF
jgi:hypothetical protein